MKELKKTLTALLKKTGEKMTFTSIMSELPPAIISEYPMGRVRAALLQLKQDDKSSVMYVKEAGVVVYYYNETWKPDVKPAHISPSRKKLEERLQALKEQQTRLEEVIAEYTALDLKVEAILV